MALEGLYGDLEWITILVDLIRGSGFRLVICALIINGKSSCCKMAQFAPTTENHVETMVGDEIIRCNMHVAAQRRWKAKAGTR